MITAKFLLSTAMAFASLAVTATTARAFIFVDQALDVLAEPPAGEEDLVFTNTEQGVTSIPFDTGVLTTGSGATVSINNNLNDLPDAVGDIVYRLFGDARFDTVTSNLYEVTLSENNQVATFTGARVNPGELFRIDRSITDGAPVDFQVTLAAANDTNTATIATVPEPATVTGLILASVAGVCLRRRQQSVAL
jgi:hypothetical protein